MDIDEVACHRWLCQWELQCLLQMHKLSHGLLLDLIKELVCVHDQKRAKPKWSIPCVSMTQTTLSAGGSASVRETIDSLMWWGVLYVSMIQRAMLAGASASVRETIDSLMWWGVLYVSMIQRAMSAGASASGRETVHSLMWWGVLYVSITQRAMSAGASASGRETVHSLMWWGSCMSPWFRELCQQELQLLLEKPSIPWCGEDIVCLHDSESYVSRSFSCW